MLGGLSRKESGVYVLVVFVYGCVWSGVIS